MYWQSYHSPCRTSPSAVAFPARIDILQHIFRTDLPRWANRCRRKRCVLVERQAHTSGVLLKAVFHASWVTCVLAGESQIVNCYCLLSVLQANTFEYCNSYGERLRDSTRLQLRLGLQEDGGHTHTQLVGSRRGSDCYGYSNYFNCTDSYKC